MEIKINGIKIKNETKGTMSTVKISKNLNGMEAGKIIHVPTEELESYVDKVKSAIQNSEGASFIKIPDALKPLGIV